MKGYFALNGQILYWTLVAPFRGQPFSMGEVFHQMVLIGTRALPMAALMSFSIGLTMAMQGATALKAMGGTSYVPLLVTLSLLRELGPLIVGVIVIGRSGSAVTAELGTMKVSEEIEALQVMAIKQGVTPAEYQAMSPVPIPTPFDLQAMLKGQAGE